MMTRKQRRWLAGGLGGGLMLLLLGLASLDTLGGLNAPERFVLTELTTFEAPPPPPPPPPRTSDARSGGSTGAELTLRSSRAPAPLDRMPLEIELAVAEIGDLDISGLGTGIGLGTGDGRGNGSGAGFELAALSELDQTPMVISAPVFGYPDEAVERGLDEFELEFYILIDEQGFTYPIALLENPFPSLSADLLEWASNVRFSPPTRLGIPVRTEYSWPVKIKP